MTATIVERTTAREYFRSAYENRYTWDQHFPGFTATVHMHKDGAVFAGTVKVSADLKLEVNVADETAKTAIREQLWEMTIHRVRRNFEDVHGKNTFEFGETDPTGAIEILIGGAASGDKYKLRDQVVTLVHRHIHGVVVTIDTLSVHNTGAGYLAHQYESIYHDPKTGEAKGPKQHHEDFYQEIGNYQILVRRIVRDAEMSVEFTFDNIQMLSSH